MWFVELWGEHRRVLDLNNQFMKMDEAKLVYNAKAELGEGPVWDPGRKCLWWVDIENCRLHQLDVFSGSNVVFNVAKKIGAAVLTDQGGILVALEDGIAHYDLDNRSLSYINQLEYDILGNRMNDGKCDPAGRFWIGSMAKAAVPGAGNLYMVTADSVETKVRATTISNGLCWSRDRSTMYYIDSPTQQIVAYDYDEATGSIEMKRTAITIPETLGSPDGMTIDEHDHIWVALWGAAAVHRYDPLTGSCLQKVKVPAPHVTSCTFGGEQHSTLYITSARQGLDQDQLEAYPQSGGVFAFETGVKGGETFLFRDG